jgi:hypothetical protein
MTQTDHSSPRDQEDTMTMNSRDDFTTDPWRSEIGTALLNAGVDTDRVTSTPDDVWTATREDGSQISFGCSRGDETGGWDYTEHDADDNVTMQDYCADAAQMAAHVADFLR